MTILADTLRKHFRKGSSSLQASLPPPNKWSLGPTGRRAEYLEVF
jgi:hypothetical protein